MMADFTQFEMADPDSSCFCSNILSRCRTRRWPFALVIVGVVMLTTIVALAVTVHKKDDDLANCRHTIPAPPSPNSSRLEGGGERGCGDECFSPPCLRTAAHVTELVNGSGGAEPCEDFHKFACGNFAHLHPLTPHVNELSTFQLVYDHNMDRLRRLIEGKQDPKLAAPYHYETKLRTFYTSCTDHFNKIQQQGRPFLDLVVQPAGGWWVLQGDSQWDNATYDFQTQLQKVHVDFWTDAFFTFGIITDWLDWNKKAIQIDLSGLGLKYYNYYQVKYERRVSAYKDFISTVSSLLLRDSGLNITMEEREYRLNTFVNDVFYVESELANIKRSAEKTKNPHASDNRIKLVDLNKASGYAVDWIGLFKYMFDQAPLTSDTYVVVLEQEYVIKFTTWINDMDTGNKSRILNNYLIWRLAHRYSQYLSWDYLYAHRELLLAATDQEVWVPPTWQYCQSVVRTTMREGLGALFVKDHFGDVNKDAAHAVADDVKQALIHSVKHNRWMSNITKHTAINKVQDSVIKLGYPDYMMNETAMNEIYAKLNITDSYFQNILTFNAFFKQDWNRRFQNNVSERTLWNHHATYDFKAAYYNPWKELLVPAGLLQFPLFDHSSPRYMNYGSMGSIVGKQLTHAIDEIGKKYQLNGSHYGNWWSEQSMEQYREVRSCMANYLINVTMGPFHLPGLYLHKIYINVDVVKNAPQVLAEAGGVRLAYMAYHHWLNDTGGEKSMPGCQFTNDQMFFLAYAQTYCSNRRSYYAFIRAGSGGITDRSRVNTALSHLPEFQKAFSCPAHSNMVTPKPCALY